jgi:hypothetical protein
VLARDIAIPYPSVRLDDGALDAVRLMTEHHLPGIVVCEPSGRPTWILRGRRCCAS